MEILAQRLRERAQQLGISNAEAARRCGLDERRYGHYASDRREPDLTTLVKMARSLGTTPNWLLGVAPEEGGTERSKLIQQITNAARGINDRDLGLLALQVEAVARRQP